MLHCSSHIEIFLVTQISTHVVYSILLAKDGPIFILQLKKMLSFPLRQKSYPTFSVRFPWMSLPDFVSICYVYLLH